MEIDPRARWSGSDVDTFKRVLRHVPEPLLVVNAEGMIVFSNLRVEELLGYSSAEMETLSAITCLPGWFTLPAFGSTTESSALRADGLTFTVEISLSPVETLGGSLIVCTLRDSSTRKAELASFVAERSELHQQIHALSLRESGLQTEMDEAACMLEAHLPPRAPKIMGLEVDWRFSPCATLGGDMLKLFPVSEDLVGFCILDVSGHGVPASLLAISLARTLSTESHRGGIILKSDGTLRRPRDVVSRLNRQYQVLQQGEHFVTLVYGVLETARRKARYVSAGHPHPIHLAGDVVSVVSGPVNPPVGVIETYVYEETEVYFEPGAMLFLFTDGVTETRSPSRELFGEDRLLGCLREAKDLELPDIQDSLYRALAAFRQNREQLDDTTSLLLRIE